MCLATGAPKDCVEKGSTKIDFTHLSSGEKSQVLLYL